MGKVFGGGGVFGGFSGFLGFFGFFGFFDFLGGGGLRGAKIGGLPASSGREKWWVGGERKIDP